MKSISGVWRYQSYGGLFINPPERPETSQKSKNNHLWCENAARVCKLKEEREANREEFFQKESDAAAEQKPLNQTALNFSHYTLNKQTFNISDSSPLV